ncbi:hypothetical protein O6H91_01G092700 [Diphasiastrum complanatum]|uniref:Uncharacterized protein n=1 Tax=Diphasiastrum complanatum TaxID=34168 RepID=A0ACC2ETS6_DIPCM|nr:hypothetical protein O6H91_01G092700 [Diphasiastrum complanatum]
MAEEQQQIMAIGKNKKRRRSRKEGNCSSDGEGSGVNEEEDVENQAALGVGDAATGSDEVSRRKMARLDCAHSGMVSDGDGRICGKDGKQSSTDDPLGAEKIAINAEAEAICGICLSEGKELDRGKLDCCEHFFCFACIMEWAKVESRCPLCKQRFAIIVKPPRAGMRRSRGRTIRIPTRNQVYIQPVEDGPVDRYANTICMECQDSGTEYLLLLCDGCDMAAHTYCVGLGRSVPRGNWYCPSCKSSGSGSDDSDSDSATSGSDEDDYESRLSGQVLSEINALVEAAGNVIRRSRQTRRAGLRSRSQQQFGRRTRRSLQTGRRGNNHAVIREFAVQEPMPPSRLLPSSSINARTLSRQRQLQDRIQHMRENWNSIRSGSVEFNETRSRAANNSGHTPLRSSSFSVLNTGHSYSETGLINTSAVCQEHISKASLSQNKSKSDADRAWSMLEQARALRDISGIAAQSTPPEPDKQRHERLPRSAPQKDILSRQPSNFMLFKDNPMSLNHYIKNYEHTFSESSRSKERITVGKSTKDDSPHANTFKDAKVLPNCVYLGDAVKQDQACKAVRVEASLSKTIYKGKSILHPIVEEPLQLRHHEKYSCRTQKDLQESDHGGGVRSGHSNKVNCRNEVCKLSGNSRDPRAERNEATVQNQTSLRCNDRNISRAGVGACNTVTMIYNEANSHPAHKVKTDLKLEYLEKKYLQNPIKGLQCNMATEVDNSSSLRAFPNCASSQAQSDCSHSIVLDISNSLQMKHQQPRSDRLSSHKMSEQIIPRCPGTGGIDARNMDTSIEDGSREELALKTENMSKENRGHLLQREAVKDRVLKIISENLTPLLKSCKIGKEKYKEIARSTTHHLLASYGLEHDKRLGFGKWKKSFYCKAVKDQVHAKGKAKIAKQWRYNSKGKL